LSRIFKEHSPPLDMKWSEFQSAHVNMKGTSKLGEQVFHDIFADLQKSSFDEAKNQLKELLDRTLTQVSDINRFELDDVKDRIRVSIH
jgi:hypothetical protein